MRDPEKLEDIHPALRKEPYFTPASAEDITAIPRRLQHSPHLRPVTTQEHGTAPSAFQSRSHSSLPVAAKPRGKLQRPQSMRKDPASENLIRRMSSRKRKNHDHVREEEIRAMSLPMPQKRPAGSSSGGMLRRDSKKVKGGVNHRFERPTSNVSLPFEDSIHSSMSGTRHALAAADHPIFRGLELLFTGPHLTLYATHTKRFAKRAETDQRPGPEAKEQDEQDR
jgi:hypothetical protein